ncbi:MAG: hypothetical protein HWN66_20105 [Candidatus Helarchaeota archaeon]|nr:hypothetical protein [Candidatus Helarchaeota archaeon]
MCQYCAQYGEGHKWYLNPKNFTEEMIKSHRVQTARVVEMLGGPEKMNFEMGAAESIDSFLPNIHDQDALNSLNQLIAEQLHGGQVIPLEDAFKIVDLTKGILLIPCYCRKYFGNIEKMTCMFFYPVSEMVPKTRPWEKCEQLTAEAAKIHLREFDKQGYVHSVYWAPIPVPIVMCNCEYPYCIGMRSRLNYGVMNAARKSEYICTVDPEKCDGCEGEPKCPKRCSFGAIKYTPSTQRVMISPTDCFGCGVCRPACDRGAMKLIDRAQFISLKNEF